ncbi:uncharacterized protein LOC124376821 isoform X1 [Silurus meridionalis]|uniref:uncharacterized protein LOC124376821 isoform X1 n=1 Tax=Silurus meridionalis TaxID=175797 RepID=UPI001EEBC284|nr:uncharacterized protein LOC124376821 isoform X1 [Silurus meridionalis]
MEILDQGTDHVTSPSKDCKLQREKSHSPVPSCVSMKSDASMHHPLGFSTGISSPGHSELQREKSHSPVPSCVSMKSDASMHHPLGFSTGISSPGHSKLQREKSHSPVPSCVSMKSDASMHHPLGFSTGISSPGHRINVRKTHTHNVCGRSAFSVSDPPATHHVLQKAGDRREKFITATGHDTESTAADEFQKLFKFNLMKKFQCLYGLMLKQENRTLLNEIYTELYITEETVETSIKNMR